MNNTAKIYIVIPAYNEQNNIGHVIAELKENGFRDIIVVDDGSRDKTYTIAKQSRTPVLRHIINRGQGAALQTGMKYALAQEADYIVHFDSDGQHSVSDISPALEYLKKEELDVLLGSRYLQNSNKKDIPLIKRMLHFGGIWFNFVVTGVKLTDSSNGFRILTRKAAQSLTITHERMDHATEIIDKIKRNKFKFKEFPVNITYSQESLKHGTNKPFNALDIAFRFIVAKLLT